MREVFREMPRKLFHLSSLLFLLGYRLLGPDRILIWMAAWTGLVVIAEALRLVSVPLNRALMGIFCGIARPEEERRLSGLFHTSIGALALFALFRHEPRIVAAALYYAAFGDASAALFGKAFGRHRIGGGKTAEGSFGCFVSCLLIGLALRLGFWPAAGGALAATAVEFVPTTVFFNDNLWMPLVSASVLRGMMAK